MTHPPGAIGFFRRPGSRTAAAWENRIKAWLKKNAPDVRLTAKDPELVLVLGGDGTILAAASESAGRDAILCGLNLGTVGFLASVRSERDFLKAIKKIMAGRYRIIRRTSLDIEVRRKDKVIAQTSVLNEAFVQNVLNMVEVDVIIDRNRIQSVRGTGILVATPTGSTGYNLSAHGPIVDPSLACMIVTEILDHSLPTPSIVVPTTQPVTLLVRNFRERGMVVLPGTNRPADVLLVCDGRIVTTLEIGDRITVCGAKDSINTVEIESNYFYKSLHEKFSLT